MYACDIRQYLISLNVFCTILPNIALTNISSYTVSVYWHAVMCLVRY